MANKIPIDLRHIDPLRRKEAWKNLFQGTPEWDPFNREGDPLLRELCSILREEKNGEVRAQGMIDLLEAAPWRTNHETPHDWFFRPFLPNTIRDYQSAVVAICDRQHIRDVQPVVTLARFLAQERYPTTRFHNIPLANPDWASIRLHHLSAICFVGRPSMFGSCDVIPQVQAQKARAHFWFSDDSETWRGKKVDRGSAEAFHHIQQNRPAAGVFRHLANQENNRRIDYAVVQRFWIKYGGRKVVVIILAGATSLGTLAATEWVTSSALDQYMAEAFAKVGEHQEDSTDLEVLLKVTAVVHEPAQPWDVESLEPIKLFVNDSVNALQTPTTITIGTNRDEVRYILFDDDEVTFGGKAYAALVALCRKAILGKSRRIAIKDLLSDSSLWPSHSVMEFSSPDSVNTFFRDNLQKHRLREALAIEGGHLTLKPRIIEKPV